MPFKKRMDQEVMKLRSTKDVIAKGFKSPFTGVQEHPYKRDNVSDAWGHFQGPRRSQTTRTEVFKVLRQLFVSQPFPNPKQFKFVKVLNVQHAAPNVFWKAGCQRVRVLV